MLRASDAQDYVLGHSESELDRLAHQARLFHDDTKALLVAAGIGTGMHVLDLGCGVGDVSMIAGELVGPSGSVLAIDQTERALEVARQRVGAAKQTWVSFDRQDINDLSSDQRFDAIVGRFVLLHFADPGKVLMKAKPLLAEDGVVAFAEMDIRSASVTPRLPLFEQCIEWITALYEKSGLNPDSGSQLYRAFRTAHLQPNLAATCRIEAGAELPGLDYVVATIRTMRPALLSLGIVTDQDLDVDRLYMLLRAEIASGDHCVIFPRLIGAWARPTCH